MSNQASTTTEGKTPGSVTFKKAVDAYLESLAADGTKPSTLAVYERTLQLAVNFFGADRKLESITLPQVGKYFASDALNKHSHNGKPKAQPTVKQNERVFRQMMVFAQTKGWIATLPIPKGKLKHARSSKATATVTPQPEAETPESVEADAPAETEIQS